MSEELPTINHMVYESYNSDTVNYKKYYKYNN